MEAERIAKRYAKSIFDLAIEKNLVEPLYKDMIELQELFQHSREFRLLVNSPIIHSIRKLEIIQKAIGNNIDKLTHSFISLLFKRHREYTLPFITKEVIALYLKSKNIFEVDLISASSLGENFKNALKSKIEQKIKGHIQFKEVINPEVIGGFIVRFDGKEYDASIASKLNTLKRQFEDISFVDQI